MRRFMFAALIAALTATGALAQTVPSPAGPPVNYAALMQQLLAACPAVLGVLVASPGDKSTWTIQYNAGATCQTAAQAALTAYTYVAPIANLQITSASNPLLNGTYAIDAATQQQLSGIMLYIVVNNAFPTGATTQVWPDVNGNYHVFNLASFKAFAKAMADYLMAVGLGQTVTQPVSIP